MYLTLYITYNNLYALIFIEELLKVNTGKVIKILRKEKKLTQDQLSEVLNVKKSSIQKYESGAVNNLKMETIKKLCQYFNVPAWMFIFPENITNEQTIIDFTNLSPGAYNISYLEDLNAEGKTKVMEYVRDLIDSGNYK